MNDLISRQAAIDAKQEFRNPNVVRNTEARTAYDRTYANGWNDCNSAWINAIKALPSAQPEPQWIPVRERLPDKNRACLITNIYGDVAWNYWIDGEWIVLPDYVVAWMPLPKPFKEGKK